jgi:hypothetical protein
MSPLHTIGQLLRDLLGQVPMPVVRGLFLALPILLLIWVLRLPKEATTSPDGTGRWDENLKLWASVALVIQIAIYSLL